MIVALVQRYPTRGIVLSLYQGQVKLVVCDVPVAFVYLFFPRTAGRSHGKLSIGRGSPLASHCSPAECGRRGAVQDDFFLSVRRHYERSFSVGNLGSPWSEHVRAWAYSRFAPNEGVAFLPSPRCDCRVPSRRWASGRGKTGGRRHNSFFLQCSASVLCSNAFLGEIF